MRIAKDISVDKSQSSEKHIIPVLDKTVSFPTQGALLYNTINPSDTIHYGDGTNWIPLASGGPIFPVINEGLGIHILDDSNPPSFPPPGYKMRGMIQDPSINNGGISISLSGSNQEVQIGNTLTGLNVGPPPGPTIAEVFAGKVANQIQMKKFVAGMNVTLQNNATDIIINAAPGGAGISGILNEGGGVEIFDQIVGTTALLRTLVPGTGISIVQNPTSITVTNSSPGSGVTLTSAGGTQTLVNDGTGPSLATKGLTAGTGITLTPSGTDITVTNSSPGSGVTLTSAGGTETLVNDGTGPSLATKGLTAGTGITLTPSGTDITISSTGASSTGYLFSYDTTTQNIVTPNTFQDIVFSTNGILNGWTHTPATSSFVCPTTGVYLITAIITCTKSIGDNRIVSGIVLRNGTEVSGSQQVGYMESTSQAVGIDITNIVLSITAADVIKIQWTADGTTVKLDPSVGTSTVGVRPSAKISITRVA